MIANFVSVLLMILAVGTPNPLRADDIPPREVERIEGLIGHVAGMKDAKFVRNGKEYDAATAAKFLRGKWEARADEVKTATDFIEKIASASSTSGKPYLVRFKNGKEVECGDYLKEKLAEFEK